MSSDRRCDVAAGSQSFINMRNLAVGLVAIAGSLYAQGTERLHLGFEVGRNVSAIYFERPPATDPSERWHTQALTGVTVGAVLAYTPSKWAAAETGFGLVARGGTSYDEFMRMNYLEIPVRLRLSLPTPVAQPYAIVGGSAGQLASCADWFDPWPARNDPRPYTCPSFRSSAYTAMTGVGLSSGWHRGVYRLEFRKSVSNDIDDTSDRVRIHTSSIVLIAQMPLSR